MAQNWKEQLASDDPKIRAQAVKQLALSGERDKLTVLRAIVENDPDPSIIYSGPLAVIVNRYSASASEIFSGAIQDYGRGLVLGEQTYGKGTVQNLIGLDRFVPSAGDKSGQLKLTIAKYYRINGSSTQNLGVVPDIPFPSAILKRNLCESLPGKQKSEKNSIIFTSGIFFIMR